MRVFVRGKKNNRVGISMRIYYDSTKGENENGIGLNRITMKDKILSSLLHTYFIYHEQLKMIINYVYCDLYKN